MSTLDTALRIVPRLHMPRSWRLVERNIASSRGAWLVFVSGFFEPLFYLLALGVGVGRLVGTVEVDGQVVAYREFVAPALLAASAMNGAVYESGNVFFKLKYAKTYDGVLATPMTVRDVAAGELTYTLLRGAVYSVGFVTVMVVLGLVDSPWAVLAVPGSLLVSAAFAAPSVFGTTLMRSWADFAFVELCTLPMFLFSATFVPADEYPDVVRWLLPLTPLYHGVQLLRAFTLGDVGWVVLPPYRLPRGARRRLLRARRPPPRPVAPQVAGSGCGRPERVVEEEVAAVQPDESAGGPPPPGPGAAPRPRRGRRRRSSHDPRSSGETVRKSSSTRSASTREPKTCGPASLTMRRWPRRRSSAKAARTSTCSLPGSTAISASSGRRPESRAAPGSVVRTSAPSSSTGWSGGIDPEAVRIATRGLAS